MPRAWAAAALVVVVWASAFAAIRAALEGFTAVELSVLRLLVASAALAAAAAVTHVRRPVAGDVPAIVAAGAPGVNPHQRLLNSGEQTVRPGPASLLVSTGPIFVALLAALTLG